MDTYEKLRKNVSAYDSRQLACTEKIKFLQDYKKYHNLYSAAMRAGAQSNFYKEHANEIVSFKASKMYFERIGENPDALNLSDLFAQYKELKQDKSADEKLYKEIQDGNWKEETEIEKLYELKTLIQQLDIPTYFATMGASNCINVEGRLPKDKKKMIAWLDRVIGTVDEKELRRYREHLPHL